MRGSSPSQMSYSFGPGPLTPAIKAIVVLNVAAYLLGWVLPSMSLYLGLIPGAVIERFWLWQPVTYMFLHGGLFHLLFNMLALWMFGVELERVWGTTFFAKFYFVAGIGAAATTILMSLMPFAFAEDIYVSITVGASGSIYGLLLAYAMYYPTRPIYLYMLFPIPARVFVLIIGAISLFSSIQEPRGGVAHVTHLGGLIAGYLYLKGGRGGFIGLFQYRFDQWRRGSRKRRFDVVQGGRKDGPNRWVH
jgi:membrane associated rhomboid family serine protease